MFQEALPETTEKPPRRRRAERERKRERETPLLDYEVDTKRGEQSVNECYR